MMKTYIIVHRGISHHIDYLSVLYCFTHSFVPFRIFLQQPVGTQNRNLPELENIKKLSCLQHQNHFWYHWNTVRLAIATQSLRNNKSSLQAPPQKHCGPSKCVGDSTAWVGWWDVRDCWVRKLWSSSGEQRSPFHPLFSSQLNHTSFACTIHEGRAGGWASLILCVYFSLLDSL